MDELILDGNAVAGLLAEAFGAELTTARGTCNHCGAVDAVGAVRVYKAAGFVLRCPSCESVLAKLVTDGSRTWIDFRGLRALEVRS
jgi:Zn finger protein HypA/HybF involved in hydrogenase expression